MAAGFLSRKEKKNAKRYAVLTGKGEELVTHTGWPLVFKKKRQTQCAAASKDRD